MRCFIAINLTKETLSNIGDFSKKLAEADFLKANFVKSDNLHLTLKFLGDIDAGKVQEIKRLLEQLKFGPFEICIKGVGGFPNENFVKVLWLGIEKGAGETTKLQRDLDDKLARIDFQRDKRFVPHLTIARVKYVRDKSSLSNLFSENHDKEFGSFWCDELHLIKSELTPGGLVYMEL